MLRDRLRLSAALSIFILALAAVQGHSDPIPYQVQTIAGLSSPPVNGYLTSGLARDDYLRIEGLSDNGQLLFALQGGGFALFLYENGQITRIPPPSGPAPGGFWPPRG